VDWDGLMFEVLEVEGSRIDRLSVVFEEPNEEPQAEVVAG
jgi:CBS domain containing-hemolysin-like protein